ncbi:hypothetical protein [Planctomycetes bacterium Poly30]|uniref:hypothetical protein n=1 Tax=Saltatorellus ferox TaxID=2528018 RepID=UPI0011A66C21
MAEFKGRVEVFDLTEMLYTAPAGGHWVPSHPAWVAPPSGFDALDNNIRAIAVDPLSDGKAMVYVGVSRVGIMSIPFDPSSTTGFMDSERHLIKTSGEVWGLSIRDHPNPARRTLLCSDGYAGHRIYSLGLIEHQAASGTGL